MIAPFAQARAQIAASDDPLVANFRLRFRPEGESARKASRPPDGEYAPRAGRRAACRPSTDGTRWKSSPRRTPWPRAFVDPGDAASRYNALHEGREAFERVEVAWTRRRGFNEAGLGAARPPPPSGRFARENNARRGNDDVTATTRRRRRERARRDRVFLGEQLADVPSGGRGRGAVRAADDCAGGTRRDGAAAAEAQRAHRRLAAIAARTAIDDARLRDGRSSRPSRGLAAHRGDGPAPRGSGRRATPDSASASPPDRARGGPIGAASPMQSAARTAHLRSNRLADDPKACAYLRRRGLLHAPARL